METPLEPTSPLKELNKSPVLLNCKTPLQNQTSPEMLSPQKNTTHSDTTDTESCKCKCSAGLGTPDRLKVPKPFKYPERYTSPTDHMISPISKGLLARSRRGGPLLPPSKIQSKISELQAPDAGQNQLRMDQSSMK